MPRRHKHQWNAGGFIEIERVGDGDDAHHGHRNQFAVAAVHAVAEHGELAALVLQAGDALRAVIAEMHGRDQHPLSRLEIGDVLSHFDNFARDVAARNVRQVDPRQAFTHPDVKMVQRASSHPYEDLIFSRPGIGDVFVSEDFGSTELMNANGFHGAPEARQRKFEPYKLAQAASVLLQKVRWRDARSCGDGRPPRPSTRVKWCGRDAARRVWE